MSIRLNKVIKEFNVGLQTVVDFLGKKGFTINASPSEKISDEQYELLRKEFGADKVLRNEAEKMYICMLNPMQTRTPAIGLLSGIGSTPFFAPIALKTLISKEPLEENEKLLNTVKLDKDDYHLLR